MEGDNVHARSDALSANRPPPERHRHRTWTAEGSTADQHV